MYASRKNEKVLSVKDVISYILEKSRDDWSIILLSTYIHMIRIYPFHWQDILTVMTSLCLSLDVVMRQQSEKMLGQGSHLQP